LKHTVLAFKKQLLGVALIVFNNFFVTIYAQFSNVKYDETKLKPFFAEAKKGKSYQPKSLGKIAVMDGRIDSLHFGLTLTDLNEGYLKIIFPEKPADYLSNKLNAVIKEPVSKDSTLLILRTLKFTETTAPTGWFEKAMTSTDRSQTNLLFDFDVYHKANGTFTYIGKIDTSLSSKGWIPSNTTKLLTGLLQTSVKMADIVNSNYKASPSSYQQVNIKDELDFTKVYPVLFIKNFKRGIYRQFTDFTGISPDTTIDFTIREEHSIKELTRYTLESPLHINTDSIWGFSDNRYAYIRLDSTFYKVIKIDNSFYVDAPETISFGITPAGKFFSFAGNFFVHKGIFRLFALDSFLKKGEEKQTYIFRYKLNVRNSKFFEK
jgi:hypothetical protein